MRFWRIVKAHGHSEEEMTEELENLQKGELWAGFDDVDLKKGKTAKD